MKDADFGLYLIHISESLRNVLEYTKDIECATFATDTNASCLRRE